MDRKEPINLSFQPISHHIGLPYTSPDFYELSTILHKGIGFVKHMITMSKRGQFEDYKEDGDKVNKKITSIKSLREDLISNEDFNSPKERRYIRLKYVPPFIDDLKMSICNTFRSDISIIGQSGSFIYPPGGYMSWHNNHKRPGVRLYCVWSEEGGSEFKYFFDNEVRVIKEHKGWNINLFRIEAPPMKFWHSVSTDTYRLSLGFRINDKKDWKHSK